MAAAEAAFTFRSCIGLHAGRDRSHQATPHRLSDDELLGLLVQRGADFVAITAGTTKQHPSTPLSIRCAGWEIPIALVPGLRGTCRWRDFRQHYFLGHDLVMLVGLKQSHGPFSRLLKAVFDQIAAIIAAGLCSRRCCWRLRRLVRADGGPVVLSPPADRRRRPHEFDCLKFRTMVVDADRHAASVAARTIRQPLHEWAATQKLRE